MGTVYVVTQVTAFGLIGILITLPFMRCKGCDRFNLWLRKKLLWNTVIRLVLEESLETTYAVVLCFKYSSFNSGAFGSMTDYILSVILAVAIATLPAFMIIFYLKYFDQWEDEKFEEIYGAPLDGLNKKKSSLFYPVYFVIRRVAFALTTLFLFNYVILQLIIHLVLTMISIFYLSEFAPQEEPIEFKLELLNEMTTVIVIDICFLFTDLDPNRKRQYAWGYVLIVVILACVGVHVYFLLKDVIGDLIL